MIARTALAASMNLLIVCLICLMYSAAALAQQSQQLQCDDFRGVRYGVYRSPTFQGGLAIAPVAWGNGPEFHIHEVVDPYIGFAGVRPDERGLMISREGDLILKNGGDYVTIGRCEMVTVGLYPIRPRYSILRLLPLPQLGSEESSRLEFPPNVPTVVKQATESRRTHWPMNSNESDAEVCADQNGVNSTSFIGCMSRVMSTPTQRAGLDCVSDDSLTQVQKGSCLAKITAPEITSRITSIEVCIDSEVNWNCVAATTLSAQSYSAYKCVADHDGTSQSSSCIVTALTDPKTGEIVASFQDCYARGGDEKDYTICALSKSSDKPTADAARCIQNGLETGGFSYTAVAICYAGQSFKVNAELRIAVECASTSSDPYSYVGCVGGRLTVRELAKCLTNGVGGSGCFGPNNEIVRALGAVGVDVDGLTNPDGEVIKAWNTVSGDIVRGPGANNDIVVAFNGSLKEVDKLIAQVSANLPRLVNDAISDVTNGPGPNNDIVKGGQAVVTTTTQVVTQVLEVFGF